MGLLAAGDWLDTHTFSVGARKHTHSENRSMGQYRRTEPLNREPMIMRLVSAAGLQGCE